MKKIVCIGGALVDETFTCINAPLNGTSNPSTSFRSPGGVSFNIAHHLSLLGNDVSLITHLGNDIDGNWLKGECTNAKINTDHSLINEISTGKYIAILDPDGNLFTGVSAMHIENEITINFLISKINFLISASLIQIDCNLSTEALSWLVNFCRTNKIDLVIDPVSVSKAQKLKNINLTGVLLITPNENELDAITGSSSYGYAEFVQSSGVKNIWIRKGSSGSEMINAETKIDFYPDEIKIIDATGAGDAGLAGWIHFYLQGNNLKECIAGGQALTELILMANGSTIKILNQKLLKNNLDEVMTKAKWLVTETQVKK